MVGIELLFAAEDAEHARTLSSLLEKEGWQVGPGPADVCVVLWSEAMRRRGVPRRKGLKFVTFDATRLPWRHRGATWADLGDWPSIAADRAIDALLVELDEATRTADESARQTESPGWVLAGVVGALALLLVVVAQTGERDDKAAVNPEVPEESPQRPKPRDAAIDSGTLSRTTTAKVPEESPQRPKPRDAAIDSGTLSRPTTAKVPVKSPQRPKPRDAAIDKGTLSRTTTAKVPVKSQVNVDRLPPTQATAASTDGHHGGAGPIDGRAAEDPLTAATLRELAARWCSVGRYGEAAPLLRAAREIEPDDEALRREYLVVGLLADNAVVVPSDVASPALCFSFAHIGRTELARSVAGQLSDVQAQRCRELIESS